MLPRSPGLKPWAYQAVNKPGSLTDLFWSFTLLALQGFGGVLAVVQRELVDKKQWLTREQFGPWRKFCPAPTW